MNAIDKTISTDISLAHLLDVLADHEWRSETLFFEVCIPVRGNDIPNLGKRCELFVELSSSSAGRRKGVGICESRTNFLHESGASELLLEILHDFGESVSGGTRAFPGALEKRLREDGGNFRTDASARKNGQFSCYVCLNYVLRQVKI